MSYVAKYQRPGRISLRRVAGAEMYFIVRFRRDDFRLKRFGGEVSLFAMCIIAGVPRVLLYEGL